MLLLAQQMVSSFQSRRATRAEIMRMFKNHFTTLKAQLNVCDHRSFFHFLIVSQGPTVQGEGSLTWDEWQASNTDGYFAVTAHWIEEPTPGRNSRVL